MKKIKSITFFAALAFSYQVFAAIPSFETKAQAVLDRYSMTLGNDENITLNGKTEQGGQDCAITVYNISKLSTTFPETSKANQRLEITIQVANDVTKFKLSRDSEVTEFSNQAREGVFLLNISANNRTGIGSGRMKQSLELTKSVGPHRSLTSKATDFGGNTLTCVTN